MTRYDATQKDETRRKILRGASRLFREKGVRDTTVPDVMESAGLTVGGFYKHFESKEDLFRNALLDALTKLYETAVASGFDAPDQSGLFEYLMKE